MKTIHGTLNFTSGQRTDSIPVNGYPKNPRIKITHSHIGSLVDKEGWASIFSGWSPFILCNVCEERMRFKEADLDAFQPVVFIDVCINIPEDCRKLSFELFFEREPEEEMSMQVFYDLEFESTHPL